MVLLSAVAARLHICIAVVSIAMQLAESSKGSTEYYTQNSVCRQQFCINPAFPGLNDLSLLEQLVWQCSAEVDVSRHLDFCAGAVKYNPSLPSPNKTAKRINGIVKQQDDAASTTFFYHLSGMGYEPWDHQTPATDPDECVRSVWKMVCYTYFPKAQAGCASGQLTPYQRPCAGPCKAYLEKCGVECCDEGLQCVFSHTIETGKGTSLLQTGFVDSLGPSAECTGSYTAAGGSYSLQLPMALLIGVLGFHVASGIDLGVADASQMDVTGEVRSSNSCRVRVSRCFIALAVLACAVTLQGCEMDVDYHQTGNWRTKPNYLVQYEFIPSGKTAGDAILNSCANPDVPDGEQCSGRGYCKALNSFSERRNTVAFCMCDRDWTDPECSTRRKSQRTAFVLSLVGGFLGLDYFYLGFPMWGIAKLATVGGCGFWWLTDIVRSGSGPIYAANHRVAADLQHWVFVLVTLAIFLLMGFVLSLVSYNSNRTTRRKEITMIQAAQDEAFLARKGGRLLGPRLARAPPFASEPYGSFGSAS